MSLIRRQIEVTFALASGTFAESGTNQVTLSGLRMSARIVKAGGPSMGTVELVIYGMTLSLMNQLSTLGILLANVPKNVVTIVAGDDVAGLGAVFQGTVTNAYADFQAAPDVPFRVDAHTGLFEAVTPVPANSFKGQADAATVMSGLATQMGLAFENNGVSVILSNPYFWGSPRSQAQSCAEAADINWIIDNGVLAIWPKRGSRGGVVPLVAPPPNGGMIGYPSYTANGLIVKTLFNPSIGFGSKVQVQSSLKPANGLWTVYGLDHELESQVPRGFWFSTLKCYSPNLPAPVV